MNKLANKQTVIIAIIIILLLLFVYYNPSLNQLNPFDTNSNGNTDDTDDPPTTVPPDDEDTESWVPVIIQTGNGKLDYGAHDTWLIDMSGYREGTTRVEVEREWFWRYDCPEPQGTVDWEFTDSIPKVCWQKFDSSPTNTYGSPEVSPNMVWDGSTKWCMTIANFASCEIEYNFRVTIYSWM